VLSSLHLLLTYRCLYECEHCFLYCGPEAKGTFSRAHLEEIVDQGVAAGISSVYFEGGEPFLYYPLLLEGLKLARARGLDAGIVTNGYWATSKEDAEMWLRPIADIGVHDLSVSNDTFHASDPDTSPAKVAIEAARALGLPVGAICIDPPRPTPTPERAADGAVIGGDVLLKGRAADALAAGLPRRDVETFAECPHEELVRPERVHVDPWGNVFVCQGISIGNAWETPLVDILARPAEDHPVVGPLARGGPAELVRAHGLGIARAADHCEACFGARRQLLDRYPEHLRPRQVYGLPD
jgi:hypothetical protein